MRMRAVLLFSVVLAACGGGVDAIPTPAPSPLPHAELKYRVMDAAGRISFCDPDFHPVARADEGDVARARIAEIQRDAEAYAAIIRRVGADPLAVYREWKALRALELTPVSKGSPVTVMVWAFAYRSTGSFGSATPDPKQSGKQVEGTVDVHGAVAVAKRSDAGPLSCPICLARGTAIATPSGEVAVERLRIGDVVWTQGPSGARIAAPLAAVGSTPVAATHQVVRIVLADGRTVLVSPGHPTADGRQIGDLRAGDTLDGAPVRLAQRDRYAGGFTFDVRPAGSSGAYWANGVLLGSTLP
jgi:hypothetical protein